MTRRRWRFFGAAPAEQRAEVKTEAQLDYRDAQIEGLRDALAAANARADAAEHRCAVLTARLALFETPRFIATTLRQRARAAADAPTAVYPARHARSGRGEA